MVETGVDKMPSTPPCQLSRALILLSKTETKGNQQNI
jgi:hypothetical protein